MKIITPELQINDDTGFDQTVDIFNRAGFGERLANLIENAGSNPVIALDAGWGQGKSTFIKMWRGYLSNQRNPSITTIYFDAFENDYQKDPFLALASEMYQLISKDDVKKVAFKDKAIKAGKSLLRGGLKLSVSTATAGIINGTVIDAAEGELSKLIAEQVDELVKDRFEHAHKDKLALKEFKCHLETFANEQGNGRPIVFIIDELDRCRPDFALELLEQVKHLFSVKGITFLLVTNRVQLEQSIKAKYGDNDPVNYLHKFINVWLTLPRAAEEYNDNGYQYLQYAIKKMSEDSRSTSLRECEGMLVDIVQYYQPSFREIERILSYFAMLFNMLARDQYGSDYQYLIAMACYLKVCKPIALRSENNNLNYELIAEIAKFDDIVKAGKYSKLEHVTNLVKFDFGDEELKAKMIEERLVSPAPFRRTIPNRLLMINQWLSNISL